MLFDLFTRILKKTIDGIATPKPIIARLNQIIVKMLEQADVKERLAVQGAEAMSSTPEALAQRVRDDLAKWGKIVRASGAKAD